MKTTQLILKLQLFAYDLFRSRSTGQTTFDMKNDPEEIRTYFMQFGYVIGNVVKGDRVFPGPTTAKRPLFSLHVATPQQ